MQAGLGQEYESLYSTLKSAPLYAAPWYLDAVCPDQWDVHTQSTANGRIMVPYQRTHISRMASVITPPLCQYLPVLKSDPSLGLSMQGFIHSAGSFSILDVSFASADLATDESTRIPSRIKYSYAISSQDYTQARSRYNEGLRRNLKEAEGIYTVREINDVPLLISLSKASYHQRGMKAPQWIELITPSVVHALHEHVQGKILAAFLDQKPMAVVLIGWDDATSYYLMGGRLTGEGAASAHALLLDAAIREALSANRHFDFEGSMHPGIANFFQSFGAHPVAYHHIRQLRGIGRLWGLFR
jgi:hypothetical protein